MLDTVDQRAIVGATVTPRCVIVDQDGEAAAAGGTVTFDVTNLAGTAVATGAATQAGTAPFDGTGRYEAATPIAATYTTVPDLWTVTWKVGGVTRLTTTIEICGGHYFRPSELSASTNVSAAAAIHEPDSTPLYVALRLAVEDQIEWATDCAWVRRVKRETFYPGQPVMLPDFSDELRTVVLDDVTLDVADLLIDGYGIVRYSGGAPVRCTDTLVVTFVTGKRRPPEPLRRAAIEAARYTLFEERTSTVDRRAVSFTNEYGSIQFARTDRDRPFGIPSVDGVVAGFSRRIPGVG